MSRVDLDEPSNAVGEAAAAAMEAARSALADAGFELDRIVVMLRVAGDALPADESGMTAGAGFEDAGDLLAFLLAHVTEAGRALGLQIGVLPIRGGAAS